MLVLQTSWKSTCETCSSYPASKNSNKKFSKKSGIGNGRVCWRFCWLCFIIWKRSKSKRQDNFQAWSDDPWWVDNWPHPFKIFLLGHRLGPWKNNKHRCYSWSDQEMTEKKKWFQGHRHFCFNGYQVIRKLFRNISTEYKWASISSANSLSRLQKHKWGFY